MARQHRAVNWDAALRSWHHLTIYEPVIESRGDVVGIFYVGVERTRIEAALAGDAGRGFAVVASEVRGLAKNATDSAKEIKALISTSAAEIQSGNKLVQNTGLKLGEVLEHVETLGGLVSDIAQSVRRQAIDLDEINGSVSALDNMTQKNASMVEQTGTAVHFLREESLRLSDSLKGFRTPQRGAGGQNVANFAATDNPRRMATGTPLMLI